MASTWKINPEWQAYNNLHNEGGEGYNPHQKWLNNVQAATIVKADPVLDNLVKDPKDGRTVRIKGLVDEYQNWITRLPNLTDAIAIRLTTERLDALRKVLSDNSALEYVN